MKRFSLAGRLAVIVAWAAGILLAISAGAVPAAMAGVMAPLGGAPHGRPGLPAPQPEPGGDSHPSLPAQAHAVSAGMPGWQIAVIVTGAALLCAALAVIAYRARASRRRMSVSAV